MRNLALLVLLSACSGKPAPVTPDKAVVNDGPPAAAKAPARSMAGVWKEYWDKPGVSDVDYNDLYTVTLADGGVNVSIEKGQPIANAQLVDGVLSFSLQTSFEVKYRMAMTTDDGWLEGTAVTPNKEVPIRWERQ